MRRILVATGLSSAAVAALATLSTVQVVSSGETFSAKVLQLEHLYQQPAPADVDRIAFMLHPVEGGGSDEWTGWEVVATIAPAPRWTHGFAHTSRR